MSGICGHPRKAVALGVGSSARPCLYRLAAVNLSGRFWTMETLISLGFRGVRRLAECYRTPGLDGGPCRDRTYDQLIKRRYIYAEHFHYGTSTYMR
jgi:hypothetical protein